MKVSYKYRFPKFLGRFGGGWEWKVGFQALRGFKTIIISLLIVEIRIEFKETENNEP